MEATSLEAVNERKTLHFERRDWLALLAAGVCAAIYAFSRPHLLFGAYLHLPGIGMTLSAWAMLLVCAAHTGWKRLRITRQSLFLLISALLLSLTYAIYANDALRLMNLPVLCALCALAARSMAAGEDLLSANGLCGGLRCSFWGSLRFIPAPFQALRGNSADLKQGNWKGIGMGLLICIPVVGLAALLLCDADVRFAQSLSGLAELFDPENTASLLWNLIRTLTLALLLFAFIYGLTRQRHAEKAPAMPKLQALSLGMVLAALCALYAVFLLTLTQPVPAEISHAESAREGFFQLVAVALLTMCVVLPCLSLHPRSKALRILGACLTLLTMGILAIAFLHMLTYIRSYGLTLLRVVTLWGMLAISAAMLAALVKCIRPGAKVCRALVVFTIVTWLVLNFANVDARIAQYNVRAYESGAMAELDLHYLASLSPDVLPAVQKARSENASLRAPVETILEGHRPCWYDWSLSWLKLQ